MKRVRRNPVVKLLSVLLVLVVLLITSGCTAADPMTEDVYLQDLFVWDGAAWNQITTNGGGGGGVPGGLDTQVQYNDGGAFGGDAGLTYDDATDQLTIAGDLYPQQDVYVGNNLNIANDLDVTDDALIGGDLTVTGSFVGGGYNDDSALSFGTGDTSSVLWETADANANALVVGLPNGGVTDVPVLAIGDQSVINKDLGLFNGITVPTLAIFNADETNRLVLDGTPMISSNTSIVMKPSADLDDYFTLATVGNIPTIYGTGSYVRIGDASTSTHSLASEDDLMVSGRLEVDGGSYHDGTFVAGEFYSVAGSTYLGGTSGLLISSASWGNSTGFLKGCATDSNAVATEYRFTQGGATYVPMWVWNINTGGYIDWGLFDGLTQPSNAWIDKGQKYATSTTATADDGGPTPEMLKTGMFTSSVVGDTVRVTAGTNAVVGWYWITDVVSANEVHLDRNWCTNNVTGGTFVAYHSFTVVSSDGILTRITDGAPSDSNVEIDRDGWVILDVSQANGRLYWRANNAWHYVDATAGISLPSDERVDRDGHEFQIGDTAKFVIDRINDDGSFHALPVYDDTDQRISDLELKIAELEALIN